ncbi:MAG: hypothetical protein HeimC2_21750 [Candidatus Heimdallarchaeota archaeon LC_2]|nr:MAG: hypothetical protein HeimC2_21750 [Candidatus Heimdallarchaeota archaeon LC_2]
MNKTICWICKRDGTELTNSLPAGFVYEEKKLFWTYEILGKVELITNQNIITEEIVKLKQMQTEKLDALWVRTFGSDRSIPRFDIDERPIMGKSDWEDLAEGIHSVKTMEIEDKVDERLIEVYYTQNKINISLCRVCDVLTSSHLVEHSIYRDNELYSRKEKEDQLTLNFNQSRIKP